MRIRVSIPRTKDHHLKGIDRSCPSPAETPVSCGRGRPKAQPKRCERKDWLSRRAAPLAAGADGILEQRSAQGRGLDARPLGR